MCEVFAVLQASPVDHSWLRLVLQDVSFVLQLAPDSTIEASLDFSDPFPMARQSFLHPMSLTRLGKRALKIYLEYGKLWQVFRKFQVDFEQDCAAADVVYQVDTSSVHVTDGFACEDCPAVFHTFKALCTHVLRKHQHHSLAQFFTASNQCRGCLKTYDSRTQVLHHLKYMRANCLLKLLCTYAPMAPEEVAEAQDQEKASRPLSKTKQRKLRRVWPVVQASGPRLPWPWERHAAFLWSQEQPSPSLPDAPLPWISQVLGAVETSDSDAILARLMQRPYHAALAAQLTHWFDAHFAPWPPLQIVEFHLLLQDAIGLWRGEAMSDMPYQFPFMCPRFHLPKCANPSPPFLVTALSCT